MKVLAALRLAVARPDLVEQMANLQTGAGPAAPVLLRRVVLRARAERRLAAILSRPLSKEVAISLGILELEAYLLQKPDEKLVHVVIQSHRGLDELAVVRGRHRLAFCNRQATDEHHDSLCQINWMTETKSLTLRGQD